MSIVTKQILFSSLLLLVAVVLQAQNERKVIRQGIKAYEAGEYSDAEVQFRKAGDINAASFEAEYNTGAALYGQEKYEETQKQYESLVDQATDPATMAHVWHNMGNSLLEAQQYAPSIEAYKNSLRLNPGDQDTKYNLAYAKKKLQEQQQQQQQNQDQQNQDQQDQEQNEDQKDQQDQEQQQNQDQQDQEQKEQQEQEQEQQEQEGQDEEQEEQEQQQPKPQEISKEDAERILQAIQQQEKDVKEKVDKKKAAVAKVKTEKDW
jgi:cobalamin biosynthesis protein CobT